ncbi:MAG: restriction endonuclease subunit S [Veillonellaceae bacterium]|nr:restriction endonuclease subunit S [Veillonellaceae bacterium]
MSKWEKARLGDVCKINMGQSPDSSTYNQAMDGIPFYQGNADFGQRYPNARYYCKQPTKLANKNDVLISVRAPIGAVNIATEKCCIGRGLAAIAEVDGITNFMYIYFFLKARVDELNLKGTGSTFKAINKNILHDLIIPLPPLEVQKKIAQTLDTASELIALRKKQLAELDNLIKSVFYDMFGDPVTNEKGRWDVKKLGSISTLKSGKFVSSSEIHELSSKHSYPCFGGNGIRGYVEKYSHEGEYCLIGRQGALCGNVQLAQGKFYATEHAVVVSPVITINTKYLLYILKKLNLNNLASGAAQPGLTVGKLNDVEIPIPPLQFQNRFDSIIQKIEEQKALVQKAIDESQYLFDSLMNEYFE